MWCKLAAWAPARSGACCFSALQNHSTPPYCTFNFVMLALCHSEGVERLTSCMPAAGAEMIAIRRMEEQKRVGAEIITIDRVCTPSAE